MKKIFTVAVVLFMMGTAAVAQNKFGYMNSLELLSLMPEVRSADSVLDKYASELDELASKMYNEYMSKSQDAQAKKEKGLLTPEQEEIVIKELADMEKRISDFQQSAEEKIGKKKQLLYEPIMKKVNDAIQAVAKANAYSYIFDASSGALLFANESDDVLPLLKKHLNLKDPAPVAPGTMPKTGN
jgi:outer membrane protein